MSRWRDLEEMGVQETSVVKTVVKVFATMLKLSPGVSVLSIILGLIQAFVVPVLIWVNVRLFDNAEGFLEGRIPFEALLSMGIIFAATFAFDFIFDIVNRLLNNTKITQESAYTFRIALGEKCVSILLLDYERTQVHDTMSRAQECVREEQLPIVFTGSISFLSSLISIFLITGVMTSYNIWFLPISLVSVIPFLIMRLIRGRDAIEMRLFQAKHTRRRDYLWKLFYNKQTVKEMRVLGFDEYLTKEWEKECARINKEKWEFHKKDAILFLICDCIRLLGYAGAIFWP